MDANTAADLYIGSREDFNEGLNSLSELHRMIMLIITSRGLWNRFEASSRVEDLNYAIEAQEAAVEASETIGHPARVDCFAELGSSLLKRFLLMGSLQDLTRSIGLFERSVDFENPSLPDHLYNFGNALKYLYDQTGTISYLERSIQFLDRSLKLQPVGDERIPDQKLALAVALWTRFEELGTANDLERAVSSVNDALNSAPDNPDFLAKCLSSLGGLLHCKFELTQSLDELDAAITHFREAIEKVPDAGYLHNLGSALQGRFQITGNMDDINDAVVNHEKAVVLTPRNWSSQPVSNYAAYVHGLSTVLERRSRRVGSGADIDRAILLLDEARHSLQPSDPMLWKFLNSLGTAFRTRWRRNFAKHDLDCAIEMMRFAVKLVPDNTPGMMACLNNLAIALAERFRQTEGMDDISEAIKVQERALELTPKESIFQAISRSNLGLQLHHKFQLNKNRINLERSIQLALETLNLSGPNDSNRSRYIVQLAQKLYDRFLLTKGNNDFEEAIRLCQQALSLDTCPPQDRMGGAEVASRILISRDVHRLLPILRTSFRLFPFLNSRAPKRSDQQYTVSLLAGITARTVSVILECCQDPREALEFLETGSGILSNFKLEYRSDISFLMSSHPELAREFDAIRCALDQSDHASFDGSFPNETYSRIIDRQELSARVEKILQSIRELPGNETFLLVPTDWDIAQLAKEGSIVLFNISELRSDAICVTEGGITSLRLSLKQDDLERYSRRFLTDLQTLSYSTYPTAQRNMKTLLQWLWDVAAEPVLGHLGLKTTSGHRERIWWIGSGLLNVLPIHAAGYHDEDPPVSVLDYVVSSYIPSIKALKHVFQPSEELRPAKALLVAMPKTHGQSDLDHADEELAIVAEALPSTIEKTQLQDKTRAGILGCLKEYNILHMSCHGLHSHDPSQSTLLLKDWTTAPLTVDDLISLNLTSRRFAMLSACHTSVARNPSLLEESLSLSTAVLLAGFPDVVGTMWQISENDSAEVTRYVYQAMVRGGIFDQKQSSTGLTEALLALREKSRQIPGFVRVFPSNPLVWAAYVHIGR